MAEKPEYLTQEGLQALQQKLDYFVDVRRRDVAERLRQALEDGGELIENSEYEDAKNEQAFIEAEITRLTQILRHATLIDESQITKDHVGIGSRVIIAEVGTQDEEEYQVVGSAEANPQQGKISYESPLGKALLGGKIGDKVKIKAPDGELTFTIKKIF